MKKNIMKKCVARKKHILYWDDWSRQGRTKISCTCMHDEPKEPTKEGLLSYVLLDSPFTSVSTVSRRDYPSLVSLVWKRQ
jgi:hypothetical protein